jgi:putative transposase
MPVAQACVLVGLSRATFYRLSRNYQHYRPVAVPMPQRDREQPAALTSPERCAVLAVITDEQYADRSVVQTYWRAFDAGTVTCSQRTFYRIAKDHHLTGDRRRRRGGATTQTSRNTPIVHATKPDDLWSWDISDLRGPRSQDRYKLYLALDVFSRCPMAWRIEHTESSSLAIKMFSRAFQEHRIPDGLHADNGASMRAHDMIDALHHAGVVPSYSRPRVSDDNPFSESLFKTIKYDLTCPDRFDNIEHARSWTKQFLHDYTHHHRHSGLGYYTPASVHDGTATNVQQHRQQALDTYYQQHPRRFRQPPQAPQLPQPTGINTHLSQAG